MIAGVTRLLVVVLLFCGAGAARRDAGRVRDKIPVGGRDPFIHGDPHVMGRIASLVEVQSAGNLTKLSDNHCLELRAVNFGGHNIGPLLWLTCELWPGRFGPYPLTSASDANEFGRNLFMAGGLYSSIMMLAQSRNNSEKFCWRRKWMREHLQPAGYSCPPEINQSLALEALEQDDSGQMQEGRWSCQDSQEIPGKVCSCGRSDLPNFRMDGNNFDDMPEKARARINSVPDGCDMVSLGHCFGECPYGFEPAGGSALTGIFKPVCVTKCTESSHPQSCGFGCANSAGNCAKVTGKQVGEVVKAVSMVTAMVTGHPQIHTIVESLIGIVEFTITVLTALIKIVVKTWKGLSAGKKKLGILIALLQFAAETGMPIVIDMFHMKDVFGQVAQMAIDLINAEWNFGISTKVISNVLKNYKSQPILNLFQLAKAFVWPSCKVAETTAVFKIDAVGASSMAGQWMRQGTHSGRPRYTKVGDSSVRIEWSEKREAWRAYQDTSWLGVGRRTLYRNLKNEVDIPYVGWEVDKGESPAPVLIAMAHGPGV